MVAGDLPRVLEDHAGDGRRAASGKLADLVAVRHTVQVTADNHRESGVSVAAAPRDEQRDGAELRDARRRVVEAELRVRRDHRHDAERGVDLRCERGAVPRLAVVQEMAMSTSPSLISD